MIYERYGIHKIRDCHEFSKQCERYSMIYVHAPFGWGKMATVEDYLEKKAMKCVLQIEWGEKFSLESFVLQKDEQSYEVIIVDGMEKGIATRELVEFVAYLNEYPLKSQLIMMSTAKLPVEMISLSLTGNLGIVGIRDLMPKPERVKEYCEMEGVPVGDYELALMQRNFFNMPLYLSFLTVRMKEANGRFDSIVRLKCRNDVFAYVNEVLFRGIPAAYQDYLLKLSYFEELSEDLIVSIFKISYVQAGHFLIEMRRYGSVLDVVNERNVYEFYPLFKHFLRSRVAQVIPQEDMDVVYRMAISFYSIRKEYEKALLFAGILGDVLNIADLIQLAIMTSGNELDYYLIEQHLEKVPNDVILVYPRLILTKVLIAAVSGYREEVEKWYEILREIICQESANYNIEEVKQCVEYLRLALPGQDVRHLVDYMLHNAADSRTAKELKFPSMITFNMPSVLHATNDYSIYLHQVNGIHPKLQEAFSMALGAQGEVMAQIAKGEAYYELDEIDLAFEQAQYAIQQARLYGDITLYFAASVSFSRVLLMKGERETETIYWIIRDVERDIENSGGKALTYNLRTFLLEIELIQGKADNLERWTEEIAPRSDERICIFNYYQYVMWIKILILQGEYTKAHIFVNQAIGDSKEHQLPYWALQLHLLDAIAYYREENSRYRTALERTIELGEPLGLIRTFAYEGAAVVSMFRDYIKTLPRTRKYLTKIVKAAQQMQTLYPYYLGGDVEEEKLTPTESEVLKYLKRGMKNTEIAKAMFVSENTVKYHLKNIYQKLDVSNRTQAIQVLQEEKVL
ncbi:MAG: LuxR C-terminal-related transcriptional regulator [Eubacteriales bacterium]